MTYEEIIRLANVFVHLGVNKLRITGGEPTIRRELPFLLKELASIPGVDDLAMTTNAHFLAKQAQMLKDTGLHRLTVSLDSLRQDRFKEVTGVDGLKKVLHGIEVAQQVGFDPIKINVVVIRDVNDDELLDFAHYARETGNIVRFIEFMPLDADKQWDHKRVVTQAEMLQRLQEIETLEPINRSYTSETANKFRFADGKGEIGIIASVSAMFCGQCSRMRLTADGKLRPCLFSEKEYDILSVMRAGCSDEELIDKIAEITKLKEAGHRINDPNYTYPEQSMSSIGG
tara:strand:+ start:4310 stop:5167 length:858 start_codon:yes stop_codon:yes gene_type:complete